MGNTNASTTKKRPINVVTGISVMGTIGCCVVTVLIATGTILTAPISIPIIVGVVTAASGSILS